MNKSLSGGEEVAPFAAVLSDALGHNDLPEGLKMKQLVSLTPEDERKISHYLRTLQQEYQLPTSPSLDSKMTKWASFVSEVESGYRMSIYDYASDLTNRDELQDILDLIGPQAREGLQEILRPLGRQICFRNEGGGSSCCPGRRSRTPLLVEKNSGQADDRIGAGLAYRGLAVILSSYRLRSKHRGLERTRLANDYQEKQECAR